MSLHQPWAVAAACQRAAQPKIEVRHHDAPSRGRYEHPIVSLCPQPNRVLPLSVRRRAGKRLLETELNLSALNWIIALRDDTEYPDRLRVETELVVTGTQLDEADALEIAPLLGQGHPVEARSQIAHAGFE